MPNKAAAVSKEAPSTVEELWPGEIAPQSTRDGAQSLFDAMEAAGVDDVDHPDGDDEPAADERPKRREADVSDDSEDESDADDGEDVDDDEDFEDADDDSEESDDASEDEDSDDDSAEDLFEIHGESEKKTLQDLKDGWLRTADYTRKRQRDAAEHADAMNSLRERRERYDVRLEKLEKTLKDIGPQKPSAELRASDPGIYAAEMVEYNEHQQQLQSIGDERGQVDGDRQEEITKLRGEIMGQQRELLLDAVPEWRADGEVAKKELSGLAEFAESAFGFTKAEVDAVVDHRLILMLRQLKSNADTTSKSREKIKRKKKSTRRLGPGSPKGSRQKGNQKTEVKRAEAQVARTGSLRDHARLLELEAGDDL